MVYESAHAFVDEYDDILVAVEEPLGVAVGDSAVEEVVIECEIDDQHTVGSGV